jgi:hypothetical protein
MTKTLYQVWIKESDGWVQAAKLYSTEKAALKDIEECDYAPDEYKIIKIEKGIY